MTYKKLDGKDIVPVENNTDVVVSDSKDITTESENNTYVAETDSKDIVPVLENNTDVVVSDSNDIVPVYDEVIENAYRKLNEIFVKNEVGQIYNTR